MTYVSHAYFIYEEESQAIVEKIEANKYGVKIKSIFIEDFVDNILEIGDAIEHVVISLSQERISEFFNFSVFHLSYSSCRKIRFRLSGSV